MKLTKEQVKRVAKLANLPIDEKEEALYSIQLSKILDYIDKLNKVKTEDVDTTFNVTGLDNVTREDKVLESLTEEEALKNAPKGEKGLFVTKGVFEEK